MAKAAFIAESARPAPSPRARALGCRVWDAEGEARIDFDMGGGAIVLGHAHLVVEAAVADPPSDAEEAAAEALLSMLPAAEDVRFTAAESQALPAAIAAARRVTGRQRVLACSAGPFGETTDLAAVVVDTLGVGAGELRAARELAAASGALLIFDEGVSAFRTHETGAEGLSGVAPDMSVHGAALANGRPLGAVAGRGDLIDALHDDDLPPPRPEALAAAAATLHVLAEYPVASQLRVLGAELQAEVARIVAAASAERFFALAGDPTLPTPLFAAPQLEGLWLREMAARGFLVVGPHAISAAHGEPEIAALVEAYADIIPAMTAKGLLEALLRRPPQPFTAHP